MIENRPMNVTESLSNEEREQLERVRCRCRATFAHRESVSRFTRHQSGSGTRRNMLPAPPLTTNAYRGEFGPCCYRLSHFRQSSRFRGTRRRTVTGINDQIAASERRGGGSQLSLRGAFVAIVIQSTLVLTAFYGLQFFEEVPQHH